MAVCLVPEYPHRDPEETRANMALITAARTLYDELRNIANARPATWEEPSEFRSEFQAWAQNRARGAIAKAEGR